MTNASKAKMAPTSNDDQFKFLISCIRYSNNGKVDFTEVARECSIVSKGAAAKRYERMMKAHGIHQTQASIRDAAIPSRAKAPMASPSKKRKLDPSSDDNNITTENNQGIVPLVKPEPASVPQIKPEPANVPEVKPEPAGLAIKDEPTAAENEGFIFDSKGQLSTLQAPVLDEGTMFQDFLQAGAFQLEEPQEQVWNTEETSQKRGLRKGAVPESILITD